MATLIRSPRRTRQGSDCPGNQNSDAVRENGQHISAAVEEGGARRLVLTAVLAFVLPVVVSVVVIQSIESRVGSGAAAIVGLVAAGLAALPSASIVRRLACRSTVSGADR